MVDVHVQAVCVDRDPVVFWAGSVFEKATPVYFIGRNNIKIPPKHVKIVFSLATFDVIIDTRSIHEPTIASFIWQRRIMCQTTDSFVLSEVGILSLIKLSMMIVIPGKIEIVCIGESGSDFAGDVAM